MIPKLLVPAVIILLISCNLQKFSSNDPIKIIFDSDMGPDYDDVGALTMLHAFADSGKAEILATMASNKYELVAPSLQVINTYYGRPQIPVGSPKTHGVNIGCSQHWTDSVAAHYPHSLNSNSKPDSISPLDGTTLVSKKVKHLVSMAGKFPEGWEFNVKEDSTSSKYVFEHWPTRIILSGFEIGEKIFTGKKLIAAYLQSPAYMAFSIAIPMSQEDRNGRMSWDETAVLAAVKGASFAFGEVNGTMVAEPSGHNRWINGENGKHSYLTFKKQPEEISGIIEGYIMHEVRKKE